MKNILFFILVLSSITSLAFAEVEYPWWTGVQFKPDTDIIENLKVSDIDSDWIKVKVLSWMDVPKEEKVRELDQYYFTYSGDVNSDNKNDKVLVG
ncbi:MAG TPA: hypothetical protein VGK71_02050, partial [Nitrospirota bacterium]